MTDGAGSSAFQQAVTAIDGGQTDLLRELINDHPALVLEHAYPADAGYFGHATLLHHVAGNPTALPHQLDIPRPLIPHNIVSIAEILLDGGAVADAQTTTRWTTLGLVASSTPVQQSGYFADLVRLLCERGADPNQGDGLALWAAYHYTEDKRRPEVIDSLVSVGAKHNLIHLTAFAREPDLSEPFERAIPELREKALVLSAFAGRRDSIRFLLERGVDINCRPETLGASVSPLHRAISAGSLSFVRFCLDQSADPALGDRVGHLPSDWARHFGRHEIADYLEAQINGSKMSLDK